MPLMIRGSGAGVAFNARLKGHPVGATPEATSGPVTIRIDRTGRVTLRYLIRLRHIAIR